jgi:predicted  nucleic acid-binding Zn-ribbon protein
MRYEASRNHLTAIIVSALFLMACVVTGAAQTQAVASPQEQFQKARENFLKGDFSDAAAEIRQAASFLKSESVNAAGEAKQDLIQSVQDLDKLADGVEKKVIGSENDLDGSFTRAEYALTRYYQSKASEAWGKKETSEAGQYLKAAGMQLEDALTWTRGRIDEKSKEAIQKAKGVGERMEKGVAVAGSDVVKYFEEANKEMNDAAQRMQSLR